MLILKCKITKKKHIERTAAVTKQEMSLKSVLMNYLGFVSTPHPHDADPWVEVSQNPLYKTMNPLLVTVGCS